MSPRPTAIISVNDFLAMGVYRALGSHGLRIPDDVSVAGFDNTHIAGSLYPSLTSVDVGGRDIGRVSVRLLLQRLADPKRPQQIVEMPARLGRPQIDCTATCYVRFMDDVSAVSLQ